jgi:protein-S-isoprenylcysteine O-methyltransferase Ste14
MQGYFAIATVVLLMGMIVSRVFLLRRMGIKASKFAEMDKKDFLILPFALFFFYLIFANALGLPKVGTILYSNGIVGWIGVVLCLLGLLFVLFSLVSFGKSFRIGIDEDQPGKLMTTGLFAFSRNPIYTSFGCILIGLCLIFIDWILLMFLVAGLWLFNRQVILEEASLKKMYGEEYLQYCKRVRRYL